jgi:hypothetical protein
LEIVISQIQSGPATKSSKVVIISTTPARDKRF